MVGVDRLFGERCAQVDTRPPLLLVQVVGACHDPRVAITWPGLGFYLPRQLNSGARRGLVHEASSRGGEEPVPSRWRNTCVARDESVLLFSFSSSSPLRPLLPFAPPLPSPLRDARSNGTEPNGKAIGVSPRGCHLKYQADCLRPRTRYPAKVSRAARNLYEAPEAGSYARVWGILFVIDASILFFLDLKKNCWGFHDWHCSSSQSVYLYVIFVLHFWDVSWFLNSYITWI